MRATESERRTLRREGKAEAVLQAGGTGHGHPEAKNVEATLALIRWYCEGKGIDFDAELKRSRSWWQG